MLYRRLRHACASWLRRLRHAAFQRLLRSRTMDRLVRASKDKAISTFHRVTRRSSTYRVLLQRSGVDPATVRTISDFRSRVPVMDKTSLTPEWEADVVNAGGGIDRLGNVLVSSGSSGHHSFAFSTHAEGARVARGVDDGLGLLFHRPLENTFLINALSMGVAVPSSIPQAATGARAGAVLAVLERTKQSFERFVIICDPHFLKHLAEEGVKGGFDWSAYKLFCVVGGDWLSEGLRSYVADLLAIDFNRPEDGAMLSTMGLTEIGYNIFHESPWTVRIRRAAQKDPRLRTALFGAATGALPSLFHYHPHRTYVETLSEGKRSGYGDVVLTPLETDRPLPVVRYAPGDCGKLISYRQLKAILREHGYADLIPAWRLPLIAIAGRSNAGMVCGSVRVTPEQVRDGLYASSGVACACTGQLWMKRDKDGLEVTIALRKGYRPSYELTAVAERQLTATTKVPVDVRWLPFPDHPGVDVSFETKFSQYRLEKAAPQAAQH